MIYLSFKGTSLDFKPEALSVLADKGCTRSYLRIRADYSAHFIDMGESGLV